MSDVEELNSLRQQIRQADEEILELLSRRLDLARKVGAIKVTRSLPIKDYRVEKEVLKGARERAEALGIYPEFAEEITQTLIKYACVAQDEFKSKGTAPSPEKQKEILVIGGGGKMGGWVSHFFRSFGHQVRIYDTGKQSETPFPNVENLEEAIKSADVIILATPISATPALIQTLADLKVKAVVFDICSLKSPLLKGIKEASKKGLKVTSIHPMFGPEARFLFGRNIVFCENPECPELTDFAIDLFEQSSAGIVRIPLDEHDKFIGYLLGLSHLTSLLFGTTLSRSGMELERLKALGSTTFNQQLAVTGPVVQENQSLYYEIQTENIFSENILDSLRSTLEDYSSSIVRKDMTSFKALMEKARKYLKE